jgi:hypothetical protein
MEYVEENLDADPFAGREDVDLSGVKLGAAEKTWLGKLASSPMSNSTKVASTYHVDKRRVQQWARIVRSGHRVQAKCGRPRKVSLQAVETIKKILNRNNVAPSGLSREEFVEVVKLGMLLNQPSRLGLTTGCRISARLSSLRKM